MDVTALEPLLSLFAITQHRNEQGKPNWTINVITDEAGTQTRSAYFDEQLGAWKFYSLSNEELSHARQRPSIAQRHGPAFQPPQIEWTNALRPSAHSKSLLNIDWSATSLGPLDTWPRSLQLYTHMLLSDSRAAAIYWGPHRIAVYNESMIPLIGALHPSLMGHSFEKIMPSLWNLFGPLFHTIERDQHGFARKGVELPLMRHGYLEETWWDGGLVSLTDECGHHGGVYFSWTEMTRNVLRDRRTKIINQLGNSSLTKAHLFWQHIHDVLVEYPRDVPMAIMYSTDERDPFNGRLHLEHTIGTSSSYVAAPRDLHMASTDRDAALAPLLYRAQESSAEFTKIDLLKEDIDNTILENVDWLGFGEPSQHLVIIPLRDSFSTKGYVVLGLNPRRCFDEDHEQFVTELARQLKETMTRAIFRHQSREREKELTTELDESQRRISRLAEIVPVGIYELAADGSLHWANNRFFEIMGAPHGNRDKALFVWEDYILPEDHHRANERMARCLLQGDPISDSLRLRKDYNPPGYELNPQSTGEPFWIMYSASPNYNADGLISSLTGSITDVSHLKWAEQLQMRNAEAAREERKIHEEFIDITSHEMRNPLSAITQSADGVLLSLQDARSLGNVQSLMDIIKLNADAAESILFCAAHQRRIIDDVLALGKLNSGLLTISPVAFRPEDLVEQAMKMLRSEFEVNNIETKTTVDIVQSTENGSTVFADSSRLLQVLVNLLTNAIKFTKTQPLRRISVRYGLSSSPPSTSLFGQDFRWSSTGISRSDPVPEIDYGQGEPSYLYFAVTDTGDGVPSDSLERIFTKFEQGERRTHTSYGGSGLGLYISRELTEIQGGSIGIESTVGVGSVFAFYTKLRLVELQRSGKSLAVDHDHTFAKTTRAFESLALNNSQIQSSLPSPRKYNILLVEDNILNQKVLAKQLRRAGCNVKTSNNGGEAVDIMLEMHGKPAEYGSLPTDDVFPYFDCILMDWEMPVCDGIEATKIIRRVESQHGAVRNLIVGITANARQEQVATAMEAGMDSVVPKPFRVAELLARISDLANAISLDNASTRLN